MKRVLLILILAFSGMLMLMALLPERATRTAFAIERFQSGLEQKSVDFDATTWPYLEGGPADAPVLLLLHGFGGDKDNWTRFSRTLTKRYRVIAPDLPGFGDTARLPEADYSLPAQRDWLARFVAALQVDRFHIGGNSMGGHIAALYAHQYPGAVSSLLLISNAGIDAPIPSEMQLALARGENPLLVTSPEDFERLLGFVSHKKLFIPWPAKRVLAQRSFADSAFNRRLFDRYRDGRSIGLEPRLAELGKPVLVIWGEFDRVLDVSSVDVMRPLLPQARIVIMNDTGHIPMLERPGETAAHYRQFLEEI